MIWSLVMGVVFEVMLLYLGYSKESSMFGGMGITVIFLLCDILRRLEKNNDNQAR